jgi:hypothetical protein
MHLMSEPNQADDDLSEAPKLESLVEARQSQASPENGQLPIHVPTTIGGLNRKYVAYTVKLPAEQLAALQSIWLELKRLYGAHSPDKSGMIQQAIQDWLKKWEGPEHQKLLQDLLEIREDTRRRQYRRTL